MEVFKQIRERFVAPIQATLGDVSQNGPQSRTELARRASLVKVVSGIAMVAGAVLTLTHLISAISFPVFGILGLLFWGVVSFSGHEGFAMSNNVEKLASGNAGILNQVSGVVSQSALIKSILKGTWILGPSFGEAIEREMNLARA